MSGRQLARPLCAIIVACLAPAACPADTITVDVSGGGDYQMIQPALDAALDGDTVLVKPGEYLIYKYLDFNLHRREFDPPPPPKNLVLRAEGGAAVTTLRLDPGNASDPVFHFWNDETAASVVEGFTITGGARDAVDCLHASPALKGCILTGNAGHTVLYFYESSSEVTDCVIRDNPCRAVTCMNSPVVLKGCTIEGNRSSAGAALDSTYDPGPSMIDCTVSGNYSESGSTVQTYRSSITLTNCTITGNRAGRGCVSFHGSPEDVPTFSSMTGCRVVGNRADLCGGVLCEGDSPVLAECVIADNSGLHGGLSIWAHSAVSATNCTITGNSGWEAGGVFVSYSSPVLKNCIVWDNAGGSLVVSDEAFPDVSWSLIEGDEPWPGTGNIAGDPLFRGWGSSREVHVDASRSGPGDGTSADPYPDLRSALEFDLALSSASPCLGSGEGWTDMGALTGSGGAPGETERAIHLAPGAYSLRGLTLTHHVNLLGASRDSTVIEGTAMGLRTGRAMRDVTITRGPFAGIEVPGGQAPEVTQCAFTLNAGPGVVVAYGASPDIRDCTISRNFFTVDGGGLHRGGGIWCTRSSSPRFTNCRIAGNLSSEGAALLSWNASPVLTNCVIAGNRAAIYCAPGGDPCWGGEGAVVSAQESTVRFVHCTATGNSSDKGTVCTGSGSLVFTGSIVRENAAEYRCGTATDSLLDVDPLFVNEGFFDFGRFETVSIEGIDYQAPAFELDEPDLRLRPGSPAIDAAPCDGAPAFDIEGNARPAGTSCDIGAYEAGSGPPPEPSFVRGEVNGDGKTDLTDAVSTLGYLFMGGRTPSCLKAADANDDGKIDLTDPLVVLGHLFMGGGPPKAPFPGCGVDPTSDLVTCDGYPRCR